MTALTPVTWPVSRSRTEGRSLSSGVLWPASVTRSTAELCPAQKRVARPRTPVPGRHARESLPPTPPRRRRRDHRPAQTPGAGDYSGPWQRPRPSARPPLCRPRSGRRRRRPPRPIRPSAMADFVYASQTSCSAGKDNRSYTGDVATSPNVAPPSRPAACVSHMGVTSGHEHALRRPDRRTRVLRPSPLQLGSLAAKPVELGRAYEPARAALRQLRRS